MPRILTNMCSMYTHKHSIKRRIRKRKLPFLLIRLVRDGVQSRMEGTALSRHCHDNRTHTAPCKSHMFAGLGGEESTYLRATAIYSVYLVMIFK